jgi:hypothetical protein
MREIGQLTLGRSPKTLRAAFHWLAPPLRATYNVATNRIGERPESAG